MQEQTLGKLEAVLPSDLHKLTTWCKIRTELLKDWHRLEKHDYTAYRRQLCVEGLRTGTLLVGLVQWESLQPTVLSMCTHIGTMVYTQKAINNVFHTHLRDFCTKRLCPSSEAMQEFLVEGQLPSLDLDSSESLDAALSREEILSAIKCLKTAKTTGSEGVPTKVYHKHTENIDDRQLEEYGETLSPDSLLSSLREVLVVMIPKPGRDPMMGSTFRPILLLHIDKILSDVLVAQLLFQMPSLIHPDQ
ncbi:hypothetical protein NDU88_001297 [Pleurodeles waltl]|uniref:Uncharacterized protein n=1 Tax=Pleurodeles waltl TaxID=8319 RepID=A0AAV7VZ18_PLEWA|nr:hypothetical protein NDU88_001297 [Pleurodeles waltl]